MYQSIERRARDTRASFNKIMAPKSKQRTRRQYFDIDRNLNESEGINDKNLGLYFRLNDQRDAKNFKSFYNQDRYANRKVKNVRMSQRLVKKGIFSSIAMDRVKQEKSQLKTTTTQFSPSFKSSSVTPQQLQQWLSGLNSKSSFGKRINLETPEISRQNQQRAVKSLNSHDGTILVKSLIERNKRMDHMVNSFQTQPTEEDQVLFDYEDPKQHTMLTEGDICNGIQQDSMRRNSHVSSQKRLLKQSSSGALQGLGLPEVIVGPQNNNIHVGDGPNQIQYEKSSFFQKKARIASLMSPRDSNFQSRPTSNLVQKALIQTEQASLRGETINQHLMDNDYTHRYALNDFVSPRKGKHESLQYSKFEKHTVREVIKRQLQNQNESSFGIVKSPRQSLAPISPKIANQDSYEAPWRFKLGDILKPESQDVKSVKVDVQKQYKRAPLKESIQAVHPINRVLKTKLQEIRKSRSGSRSNSNRKSISPSKNPPFLSKDISSEKLANKQPHYNEKKEESELIKRPSSKLLTSNKNVKNSSLKPKKLLMQDSTPQKHEQAQKEPKTSRMRPTKKLSVMFPQLEPQVEQVDKESINDRDQESVKKPVLRRKLSKSNISRRPSRRSMLSNDDEDPYQQNARVLLLTPDSTISHSRGSKRNQTDTKAHKILSVDELVAKFQQQHLEKTHRLRELSYPQNSVQQRGKSKFEIPSEEFLRKQKAQMMVDKKHMIKDNIVTNIVKRTGANKATMLVKNNKRNQNRKVQEAGDPVEEYCANFSSTAEIFSFGGSLTNKSMMYVFGQAIRKKVLVAKVKLDFARHLQSRIQGEMKSQSLMEQPASLFNARLEQETQTVQKIGDAIKKRFDDYETFKKANMDNTPTTEYFKACKADMELVLPILDKINQKTLCLQEYTLSPGHCRGLSAACEKFDSSVVNRVLFNNCGIDGDEFALILQGLVKLKDFKSIIYKMNTVNQNSVDAMKPIFQKRLPNHLKELKLIDCKIDANLISQICEYLIEQRSQLQSLALVNVNNSEHSFQNIIEFIEFSNHLQELDLSWSTIRPSIMMQLMQVLRSNDQLTWLNLGWNHLLERQREELTKEEKEAGLEEVPLEEFNMEMMQCLKEFIKYNPSLIHLDLTACGLNRAALKVIAHCLTRAQSLQTIHLCSNSGLQTPGLIDWFQKRIRAKSVSTINYIKPYSTKPSTKKQKTEYPKHRVPKLTKMFPSISDNNYKSLDVLDRHTWQDLRQMLKMRYVVNSKRINEIGIISSGIEQQKFIVQRILGFRSFIPNSQKWSILSNLKDECTYCSQHVITLFIWNLRIGQLGSTKDQDKIDYYKDKVGQFQVDSDFMLDSPTDVPQIAMAETNWNYRDMIDAYDYCVQHDPNPPDFVQMTIDEGLCRQAVRDQESPAKMTQSEILQMEKIKDGYYQDNWASILITIVKYDNPQIANLQVFTKDNLKINEVNRVYFHVDFLKPGMHTYVVKYEDNQIYSDTEDAQIQKERNQALKRDSRQGAHTDQTFFVHDLMAGFRQDPVPAFTRKRHVTKVDVSKELGRKIFAKWKNSTADTLYLLNKYDQGWINFERYSKDATVIDSLQKQIAANIDLISEIYNYLQSKSKTFPWLDNVTLTHYYVKQGRLFLNDRMGTLMHSFELIQSQLESRRGSDPILQDKIPAKSICRFQFIELLISVGNMLYGTRIARKKQENGEFIDQLQRVNVSESFMIFLNRKLVPFKDKFASSISDFRYFRLFDDDVGKVFHYNNEGFKAIYEKYSKNNVRVNNYDAEGIGVQNFIQLFKYDSELMIAKDICRLAYTSSKQPVVSELDSKGALIYQRLTFVEFLESCSRIAELFFEGSEMQELELAKKIEHLLDEILPIVGHKRIKQRTIIEDFSESDDDY